MAKNSYKMIKEIKEQPQIVKKIISKHIKGDKIVFNEFKGAINDLSEIKRFIFLGCGTSYHAALYGNLVFEEITKLNCEFEFADEFNRRHPVIEFNTAVIILSQSGETAEAIKAAKIVKQKKAFLISITNNKKSKLAKLSNVHIDIEAGKEIAVPATKTFTSQLLILILLSLLIRQGRTKNDISLINQIKKLPALLKDVIAKEKMVKKLAEKLEGEKDIIILGSKYNYPIALEGALKFKEAANIFAEGMTTEEYEHGPKALSDKVGLIKINKSGLEISKRKISVSQTLEVLLPLLLVLPLQLLAFYLAIQKGINVDRPRNIKKFVK
jgi:glutamine---fructose-6-phosphate transaminase (isomerizing)